MVGEVQYLQTQINELQNTMAAHKMLMTEAMDKAGENKQALRSAHERLDVMQTQLVSMHSNQVTKEAFEEILETTFNRRIVSGIKKALLTVSGVAVTTAAAWFFDLFASK